MLVTVLLLLLMWFVLLGFLSAWTLFFQGYLYTEPTGGLFWRAPAAATILTIILALWITVDYRAVKHRADARFPYGPLQELAPATTDIEPFPTLLVPTGENEM